MFPQPIMPTATGAGSEVFIVDLLMDCTHSWKAESVSKGQSSWHRIVFKCLEGQAPVTAKAEKTRLDSRPRGQSPIVPLWNPRRCAQQASTV